MGSDDEDRDEDAGGGRRMAVLATAVAKVTLATTMVEKAVSN